MGFFEDDRIRHKNQHLNHPAQASEPKQDNFIVQLERGASMINFVNALKEAGFIIQLNEDHKSIVVSKPS